MEATQKTRAQILSGDLPQDDVEKEVTGAATAVEEEKKEHQDPSSNAAVVKGEEDDTLMKQQFSSKVPQFSISEDVDVSDSNQ